MFQAAFRRKTWKTGALREFAQKFERGDPSQTLGYLVLDLSDLSVLGPYWRYTRYGPYDTYGFVMG